MPGCSACWSGSTDAIPPAKTCLTSQGGAAPSSVQIRSTGSPDAG